MEYPHCIWDYMAHIWMINHRSDSWGPPASDAPCLQAVAAQAMYDGGYWQSTGIGQYATGAAMVEF